MTPETGHRRTDRPGLGRRLAQRRARERRARPAREPDRGGADDDVHRAVAGPHAGARLRRRRPAVLRGRRAADDHDEQGDHDDRAPSDDDVGRRAARHRPGRARRGRRRPARRRPRHGRVRRDLDRRGRRDETAVREAAAPRRARASEDAVGGPMRGGDRPARGRARRARAIRSTAASRRPRRSAGRASPDRSFWQENARRGNVGLPAVPRTTWSCVDVRSNSHHRARDAWGASPPTPVASAASEATVTPAAAVTPEAPTVARSRPSAGQRPGRALARRPRGAQRDGARRLRRATSGSATSPASSQLPKSTLHRICAILVDRGWALRDEQGRYEPGVRAIGLGSRAAEPADRHRLPPRGRRPHDAATTRPSASRSSTATSRSSSPSRRRRSRCACRPGSAAARRRSPPRAGA